MTKEQAARLRQGDSVGYGRACVATVLSFQLTGFAPPYVRLGPCTVHDKKGCPNRSVLWAAVARAPYNFGVISYRLLTK